MKKQVTIKKFFKKVDSQTSQIKSHESENPLKEINSKFSQNYQKLREQLKEKASLTFENRPKLYTVNAPAPKAKRVNKTYSLEENKAILELATTVEPSQISKDYRIPYSTLKEWINNPNGLEDKRKRFSGRNPFYPDVEEKLFSIFL